ncbi:hypothetical protein [Streptomyces sp. NRRL F-2664]|uniref:hypothetical protein n=1 Tax=Streptomyces sp. NRRL F-2664 TaxID=1463842 RepID=UPI0004CB6B48|nr:hypothetical protein [Streptomyces sp. NRRL F-2664]
MPAWASWTTPAVYAAPRGVRICDGRVLTGEIGVHTTWTETEQLAHITVQYTGANDWHPLPGSPVPCRSEEASRTLHDTVVHAIQTGQTGLLAAGRP